MCWVYTHDITWYEFINMQLELLQWRLTSCTSVSWKLDTTFSQDPSFCIQLHNPRILSVWNVVLLVVPDFPFVGFVEQRNSSNVMTLVTS